jgi:hypothetical protein
VPAKTARPSLESLIEARCCTLATRLGCHPIKLGGFVVGLPDRAFLLPGGGVWLVEFKAPGGAVSPRQKYHFRRLMEIGHKVSIISAYNIFQHDLHQRLGLPIPGMQESLDLD